MIHRILIILCFSFLLVLSYMFQDMPHGDNFALDCDLCHATDTWQVLSDSVKFRHSETGFALIGAHKNTQCRSCHEKLEFNYIGTACIDCHPDIHKSELGFRCENCHTPLSWENRREVFEQHIQTNFPLIGVHALLDCQSCHIDEQNREFVNLPVECQGCHLEDFNQTVNPDHKKASFDQECQSCHPANSVIWNQSIYHHTDLFPLAGGHSSSECRDCHSDIYFGLSADCYSCHQTDYENANDPNHLTFGFPEDCRACHNIYNWETADFDHLAVSGFELRGAHTQIQCTSCHINNQINGLPRECWGCHQDEYNAVKDPDHIQAGFSQNCLDCHTEISWSPASFDHDQTSFTLTGAHISVDCAGCHINGQFAGTPTDCWSCHEIAYTTVSDPNHVSGNFNHDCTVCHNTSSWSPATFSHNDTQFPLTGAHLSLECISCHESGYANTPLECYTCHQTAYDNTNDPDHQAAQFPTTCEDCHSTIAWEPANWDHDSQYFPIYSGSHREAWDACSDCHNIPASYAQFECINCHKHDLTSTNEDHHEVQDYSYDSPSCYHCHPDGRSDD